MKLLIAEDDIFIGENISMIARKNGYSVSEIVQSMDEFNSAMDNSSFDAALLDIRMNGVDLGVEMAANLHKANIPFAFITSFSDKETLKRAIATRPIGYIVKPFKKIEVEELLSDLAHELDSESVVLKYEGLKQKVYLKDIMYLQSENVYVTIFKKDGNRIVVRTKLGKLMDALPPTFFLRTHQSYCVNKSFIHKLEGGNVLMQCETKIPVSRKYEPDIKRLVV